MTPRSKMRHLTHGSGARTRARLPLATALKVALVVVLLIELGFVARSLIDGDSAVTSAREPSGAMVTEDRYAPYPQAALDDNSSFADAFKFDPLLRRVVESRSVAEERSRLSAPSSAADDSPTTGSDSQSGSGGSGAATSATQSGETSSSGGSSSGGTSSSGGGGGTGGGGPSGNDGGSTGGGGGGGGG